MIVAKLEPTISEAAASVKTVSPEPVVRWQDEPENAVAHEMLSGLEPTISDEAAGTEAVSREPVVRWQNEPENAVAHVALPELEPTVVKTGAVAAEKIPGLIDDEHWLVLTENGDLASRGQESETVLEFSTDTRKAAPDETAAVQGREATGRGGEQMSEGSQMEAAHPAEDRDGESEAGSNGQPPVHWVIEPTPAYVEPVLKEMPDEAASAGDPVAEAAVAMAPSEADEDFLQIEDGPEPVIAAAPTSATEALAGTDTSEAGEPGQAATMEAEAPEVAVETEPDELLLSETGAAAGMAAMVEDDFEPEAEALALAEQIVDRVLQGVRPMLVKEVARLVS